MTTITLRRSKTTTYPSTHHYKKPSDIARFHLMKPLLFGHERIQQDLLKASRTGRLPQVLLITGDQGVGRQSFGRWLAAVVLCQSAASPCGACQSCRLVSGLTHPDFHWFVPLPRPKAGDPDKQMDEVRESLGELMAARRETPVYSPPDGMAMHGVATARLILKTSTMTTVMGGRRVLLIGDAERLVPQEASQEAANALLKFLEEPPASALIILTTTDPNRVLPTIRSRAVPIRLGRLDPATVAAGLAVLAPDLPEAERRRRVAAADGSLGKALGATATAKTDEQVEQLLTVARQGGAQRFERVLRQGPWQARGDFTELLDRLASTFSQAVRVASGGLDAPVPEALRTVASPTRFLIAIEKVDAAREAAQGNVNPQLLLATLTGELAEALWA